MAKEKVRPAKAQPKGTARKQAVKQGAANDNKTQPNSGCNCK